MTVDATPVLHRHPQSLEVVDVRPATASAPLLTLVKTTLRAMSYRIREQNGLIEMEHASQLEPLRTRRQRLAATPGKKEL